MIIYDYCERVYGQLGRIIYDGWEGVFIYDCGGAFINDSKGVFMDGGEGVLIDGYI